MNKKIMLHTALLVVSVGLLLIDLFLVARQGAGYYIVKIAIVCVIVSNAIQLKSEYDKKESTN